MKTKFILAIFLFAFASQPTYSQSLFGWAKEAWSDVDNAFTGDRDAAEAAKRKEEQQKAADALRAEQAKAKAEKDAAIAERIAVHDLDANGENQLMRAIRAGDTDVSKDLIKRGANATLVNNRGVSTLHEAVRSENASLVQLILVNGGNVNAVDGFQKTPLDIAMQFPNNDVVQKLVMNNAPITLSHIDRAIQLDKTEVLTTLLQNGGNPEYVLVAALERNKAQLFQDVVENYNVKLDNSVFDYAIDKRNFEIAEYLLSTSVDPNKALDYAISKNAKQIMDPLLNAGANADKVLTYAIDKRDQQLAQNSIMMFNADPNPHLKTAVTKNNIPMVDMLLMNGADPNKGLSEAVSKNSIMMVNKLLDAEADPNAQMSSAASGGKDQIVQAFLDRGADANKGAVPAATAGKYNTAKLLVKAGADANPVLPLAVSGKNLPLVEACIEAGADPNLGLDTAFKDGETKIAMVLLDAPGADASPVSYMEKACNIKSNPLVAKLIEKGADPNDGMDIAVNTGQSKITSTLLAAGADATPAKFISKACELQNADMVGKLLEAGADANNGMEMCIEKNDENILTQLLGSGADGTSPKFIKKSCTTGNVSITQQLIAAGADASSKELLEPAVKHNNEKLTALLFDNGADVQATARPAVEANANQVLNQISKAGADLTGGDLLNTAVSRSYSTIAEILLRSGSDPNAPTVSGSGYKMIHVAAQNKDFSTGKLLIHYKADVTTQAVSGDTPLHVLAMQKNPGKDGAAFAEAMIMAGADVNARNGKDELVFQVCRGGKVKGVLKKNNALRK